MQDFKGAIEAGWSNEDLNKALGTEGKDFVGAISAGWSNEDIASKLNPQNKATPEVVTMAPESMAKAEQMLSNENVANAEVNMQNLGTQYTENDLEAMAQGQTRGIEAPVVSPEMIVGLVPKATAYGAGVIFGEVLGSVGADAGIDLVSETLDEDFKKENPITSSILEVAGGIGGAIVGGKLGQGIQIEPDNLFAGEWKSIKNKMAEANLDLPDISNMEIKDKVSILNAIEEAEKAGIKLFGSDINPDTSLAQLEKSMMKNPLTAGAVKKTTDQQKKNLLQHIQKTKEVIASEFTSVDDVMNLTKERLNLKSNILKKETDKAYATLRELGDSVQPIANNQYEQSLSNIKNIILEGKYSNDPKIIKDLESFIDDKLDILARTGAKGSFEDLYGFMNSIVTRSSDMGQKLGGGSESRAFALLAQDMGKVYDELIEASGNAPAIKDTLKQAKSIYKRRVDYFGYRDTGKGSDSFIPKFMEKIKETPDQAVKMIKNSKDWSDLTEHLDENTLGLVRRAKIEDIVSKSQVNDRLDLIKFSNNISKENKKLMVDMFGKDTFKTIVGIGKVSSYVGKRSKLLENANILGLEGLKQKVTGLTSVVPTINLIKYVLAQKIGSSTLAKTDQNMLMKMKRDIIKTLKESNINPDEFIQNADTLLDDTKFGVKISKRDTFVPPEIKDLKTQSFDTREVPKAVKQKIAKIKANARKKQSLVNGKSLTLEKAEKRLSDLEARRSKLEANGKPTDSIEEAIDLQEKTIAKAQQDYNISQRELRELEVEMENIPEFNPPRPTTKEPKVNINKARI